MNNENKSQEEVEYEIRLRRRLKILQEQFKAGKVKIMEGLDVVNSLEAVRLREDGEVDLTTVDGLVRSMALAVTAMHDREELKNEMTLSEIQTTYFSFIYTQFNEYYEEMVKHRLTPHAVSVGLTRNKDFVDDINKNIDEFLNVIYQFWESVGEIAHIHMEDMHGNIKGVFGGDLFPSHNENIASKCGIYADTIILPDPFVRSKHVFENQHGEERAYYLIKHAMNILQYRELACADVNVPIVVILPDLSVIQEGERDFFHSLGKQDSLVHAGKLFGRRFDSFDELLDFAKSLDTVERAVAEIEDSSRILFDTDWTGDAGEQIKRALNNKHYNQFVKYPGVLLASQSLSRMSISNEILVKARRLNGTPIIDAPTSWQYLVWKMEYDAQRAEAELKSDGLHIIKGLNDLADKEMQWIGNIPPQALIQLRKDGALDEIRVILGAGIKDIIESNPSNFFRSRDAILENIDSAFRNHQKNLDNLISKKWKFAGKDIGSWLVVGALEVTAAVTGTPVWGLATIAADQLLEVPKLKDIPQSIRDLADENNKIKKSPVGMLFNIHKKC